MVKKKRHKAFWSNIKFKYKLTIINENTLISSLIYTSSVSSKASNPSGKSIVITLCFWSMFRMNSSCAGISNSSP